MTPRIHRNAQKTGLEGEGIIKRRIGTAHLELDQHSSLPHWYVFGQQLADFLRVPNLGDAFALLLAADRGAKDQYLAARRVPAEAVDEARIELSLPVPDEDEEVRDLLAVALPPNVRTPTDDEATRGTEAVAEESSEPEGESHRPEPNPPDGEPELSEVDHSSVTIEEADRDEGGSPGKAGLRRSLSLGRYGPVDHDRQSRIQRRIGRRGEEVAYEAERKRVAERGGDPAVVQWISKERELAPYDLESMDDDGQKLFIEVKSTTSDDPFDPFEISEAELLFGLQKRSRYAIYRVTSAHLAVASHEEGTTP